MPYGPGFFTRCGDVSNLRLSALRLAKYSTTSIGYFLEMPSDEFYEWVRVMNGEIERENNEMKESMESAKGGK